MAHFLAPFSQFQVFFYIGDQAVLQRTVQLQVQILSTGYSPLLSGFLAPRMGELLLHVTTSLSEPHRHQIRLMRTESSLRMSA